MCCRNNHAYRTVGWINGSNGETGIRPTDGEGKKEEIKGREKRKEETRRGGGREAGQGMRMAGDQRLRQCRDLQRAGKKHSMDRSIVLGM